MIKISKENHKANASKGKTARSRLQTTFKKKGSRTDPAKVKTMNSKINRFNPSDYERNINQVPKKWIDHFNKTPRTIRCVSDGKEEMKFFEDYGDDFAFGPIYWIGEDDDFTYYLRAIARDNMLEKGKEYKLVDTYLEGDMEFGMVMLEGEPKDADEWEGFHGYPAFLFEELEAVPTKQRVKNMDAYWESDGD